MYTPDDIVCVTHALELILETSNWYLCVSDPSILKDVVHPEIKALFVNCDDQVCDIRHTKKVKLQ